MQKHYSKHDYNNSLQTLIGDLSQHNRYLQTVDIASSRSTTAIIRTIIDKIVRGKNTTLRQFKIKTAGCNKRDVDALNSILEDNDERQKRSTFNWERLSIFVAVHRAYKKEEDKTLVPSIKDLIPTIMGMAK